MLTSTVAHDFICARLGEEYPTLLSSVISRGEVVQSRAGETREVLNLRLVLTEPKYCLTSRDGFSDAFMHEEILQLLAGVHDNERLAAVVPRAAELLAAPTAYGPRIYPQLELVADELKRNPSSRRTTVYVGRADDLERSSSAEHKFEMPCTQTLQFHLRGKEPFPHASTQPYPPPKLHMTVTMRSWDLVWGLGYDVPSFVALQLAVADHLGATVGEYVHYAGSAHVYDRHYGIRVGVRTNPLEIEYLLRGDIRATRAAAAGYIQEDDELLRGEGARHRPAD